MKILANDGISKSGIELLTRNGFEVITTRVAQEQIVNFINSNQISALVVRSSTKVTPEIIDNCPNLKVIARAGVGMENIDVEYAKSKGMLVFNTPESSVNSVAELVFAHLFSGVRFLHDSNRNMPLEGDIKFNSLKNAYSNGIELKGKTLGIIGLGRIGKEVARIGFALGMKVIAYDTFVEKATIRIEFFDRQYVDFEIKTKSLDEVLINSDFITLHVPSQDDYLIGAYEIEKMKDGVGIINCSRGDVIDEVALVEALDRNKVLFAGLDVFENEPNPEIQILMNPKISLTPHIGASTIEAQERIGLELANQLSSLLR